MPSLFDRRAFSDFHGLAMFGRGEEPSMDETRRRLFVVERRSDVGRPDHFYKGYLQQRFGGLKHVGEIAPSVLGRLAERYLERRGGRVAVRFERFGEWHELLPYVSPLAVIVAFLVAEGRGPRAGLDPRPFLAEEIGDSALLGACDRDLEDMIGREGLCELHMHLNGSTELDILWPDAVVEPEQFHAELRERAQGSDAAAIAELYDQLEPGILPYDIFKRLRAARRVRRQMVLELESLDSVPEPRIDGRAACGRDAFLDAAAFETPDSHWFGPRFPRLDTHPGQILFGGGTHRRLVDEAGFLYAVLQALAREPRHDALGYGLYFNFLVLAQIARLAVQQVDETGFDQFQKYTFVGTREGIEQRYGDRFRQLNGRHPYQTLAHLEGRFAPKTTREKTIDLVARIVDDYLEFRGCRHRLAVRGLVGDPPPCLLGRPCRPLDEDDTERCDPVGRPGAELTLVAHFIKKTRTARADEAARCRDLGLRRTLDAQARMLAGLVADNAVFRALVQAVDGASNELHAPPEPFAPAFRHARAAGIRWATFHVGEDFRHLASGIRAVQEALTFLDLGAGDRIGHGTALGIDPGLWLDRAAPRLMISALDLLDDAVFAHRALAEIGGFERDLAKLDTIIAEHSSRLYGAASGPVVLERAWRLRSLDAIEVRNVEREIARHGRSVDAATVAEEAAFLAQTVVDPARARELRLISERVRDAGEAYAIFSRRHALAATECDRHVEVDAKLVSAPAFAALQDHVLRDLCERGVAIETLPTSNLRISFYETLEEHHVFRWLGLAEPMLVNRPVVVVGSDDPGIFATSLKNEYAALGSVLTSRFALSASEASVHLHRLRDASRIRRFRPAPP